MNKTENKYSFRKVLELSARGLKVLYKHYPQMIISRFSNVIWNSLTPYVGIYMSALIIE